MLKEVHYYPFDEPQFVVIWEYNNKIWSNTLRVNDETIEVALEHGEEWKYNGDNSELFDDPASNTRYFIFTEERKKAPEIGDTIEITINSGGCRKFFNVGDKAVAISIDCDGDFWADFNNQGNNYVEGSGVWCIGHNHPTKNTVRFKVL